MGRNLETRIERLEARGALKLYPAHRIIMDAGDCEDEARKSYELDSGRKIGRNDLVVLRIIVDPK